MTRSFVLVCFLLSGASGLVYEVVWMRQLELTVGATTGAVSALLAVFMAGLGTGARIFGPVADRSRAPLRVYGFLEVGIGIYALAFPWLLEAAGPAYLALARPAIGLPAVVLLLRVAYASALLLLPTMCMGGTLPLLVRFVRRTDAADSASGKDRFGWDLGTLYGANLAGALVGTVASGFVLIRVFGLHGATLAAAIVNLAVGVSAILWDAARSQGRPNPGQGAAEGRTGARLPGPRPRTAAWAAVVLSGFVTVGYQVLWTRILTFAFTSTVYAFTIILATVLGGLALGSAVFAVLDRTADRLRLLGGTLMLGGITAAGLSPASTTLPALITAISERWGYTGGVFLTAAALSSAVVILVPATLMGLVFPLASRVLAADGADPGRQIGRAYVANTAGAVAGALGTGFLLIPFLGIKWSLLTLAAAQVAAGAALLRSADGPPWRFAFLAAVGGLAGASLGLRGAQPFDTALAGQGARIEASDDGVVASTSVVRYPDGRRALRIDGFEAAGDGGPYGYMNMMTHVPALLHPGPRRVLVICFGTGTTAGAVLAHPGVAVDVVDLNPAVFAFAPFFQNVNHGVAASPRARLVLDDGRNHLATTAERYDIITSEPMPPTFAGMVRLYSREYYTLARERLRPGGYIVQWLPFHLLRLEETLAIVRTVHDVFPRTTTVWAHGENGFVVARRDAPVEIELGLVRARLGAAAGTFAPLGVGSAEDFVRLFMVGPAGVERMGAKSAAITDDRPSLEFHPPQHRTAIRVGHGYRPDEARALEVVYRLRSADGVPLRHAAGGEGEEFAREREVQSRILLGDLYLAMWLRAEARQELEQGLRGPVTPSERAALLERLGEVARRDGRLHDAGRLLEESLALAPAALPSPWPRPSPAPAGRRGQDLR